MQRCENSRGTNQPAPKGKMWQVCKEGNWVSRMSRGGTGKGTDGCPGNGWLTVTELCPPLLVWKNLQTLMLPMGFAVLYLDARPLIIQTFEKDMYGMDMHGVKYHISNSTSSLSYPIASEHPLGWVFYGWILPIEPHWYLCEQSSTWHFSHRPGFTPTWTF